MKQKSSYDFIQKELSHHLITEKFDSKTFKDKYPEIDIHKNNPTILYIS